MLFNAHARGDTAIITPFSVYYETPNSILTGVRDRRLSIEDGRLAVSAFVALRLPVVGTDHTELDVLIPRAFELADELGTSFYDAVFLATADLLDLPLVTADDRFHRRVSGKAPTPVLWIGSLPVR